MTETIIASLARIADFDAKSYDIARIARPQWATGDYVVGEITHVPNGHGGVEDCAGRMIPVRPGDRMIGAFGDRAATLEGVGSWADIVDGKMDAMTSAGLFGSFTSVSMFMPDTVSLNYLAHVVRKRKKTCMRDFAISSDSQPFSIPTILLVGTSMSSGKTLTGKLACKILSSMHMNVVCAKLTGAGRYRDIIGFRNSGAGAVFDFVDAGLPSTVVPEKEFRTAIRPLLHHIQNLNPDILIAEAGASPLEPYNGAAAIDELNAQISCTILSASDPYAVVGVMDAFGLTPDLVTGPATNTTAAIELIARLTGLPGINILDRRSEPEFQSFLKRSLASILPSS